MRRQSQWMEAAQGSSWHSRDRPISSSGRLQLMMKTFYIVSLIPSDSMVILTKAYVTIGRKNKCGERNLLA